MAGISAPPGRKSAASDRKFGKRFTEAVRRRTYPNSALHPKQLAHAAGCSVDSFLRWLRGESRVPGEAIDRLVAFFEGAGDRTFLAELFSQERIALDLELADLKRRLARLEQDVAHAPAADRLRLPDAAQSTAPGGALDGDRGAMGGPDQAVGRVGHDI